MIAMVGLLEDARAHATMGFAGPGHAIAVVGQMAGSLAGSEYLARIAGQVAGIPEPLSADAHRRVFDAVLAMIRQKLVASAHDVSEGGLALAIAECAIAGEIGAAIELSDRATRPEELWFGEAPARFVISFAPDQQGAVETVAQSLKAPMALIGTTGGSEISLRLGSQAFAVSLGQARDAYQSGFRAVSESS